MKTRIITTTMLFVIGITIFYSCSKSVDATTSVPTTTVSVPTPALLAGDPAFGGLFDALNHFDPHYLQLVYNDQRTTDEIISKGKNLVDQLREYPTNIEIQQQLADFYKFKSIAALKYYSDQILINSNIIRNKYFSNDNNYTNKQVEVFMKARSIYAKNKMDSVKNNTNQIKSSSMYDDYVLNPSAPAFQFFAEMDLEGIDVGGGEGCADACCLEYVSCNQQSARNFLGNSVNIGATLATGAGITGAGIASLLPVVGTIAGASVGISIGSYFGVIIARQMYSSDLYTCTLQYKACLLRKNGH
jgi:hypothetical protein